MIQLQDIQLFFGNQAVFDDISAIIQNYDRIGLVGRNGSGKTTLLKAIVGIQKLDAGVVTISGGCKVAYLPQEVVMSSTRSIVEEVLAGNEEIGTLRERMFILEPLVEAGDADAVNEYGSVIGRLSELEIESVILQVKDMLRGLGFKEEQFNDGVMTFSVGWQMRVVLAKMLISNADFYLFDEPTNHLDIVAKDWFLNFVKMSSFGFLLVCHEKYFMNQLCTEIFDLERGNCTQYSGNYDAFEEQKEHNLNSLQQAYTLQQKEIKKKEELIAKFKAKASKATMAKSMEKALDRMEVIELPPKPRNVNFNFGEVQRAGKVVFTAKDLAYSFDDKQIFSNVSFQIERGEKVALIAANGAGKTTLFNVLSGKYKLQTGTMELGYNVITAVFEQEQHKVLDPNKTVLEEVFAHVTKKSEELIRSFLGAFLFGRQEIVKKTKVLSGGEKNRLSMVKVLLQDANFLLLDEPTNHLDIPSKEILLRALDQFHGTVLFVSHDQDFVNTLATRVFELTPTGINSYHGNYESYLQQKNEAQMYEKRQAKADALSAQSGHAKSGAPVASKGRSEELDTLLKNANEYDIRKALQKIERKVANLERDLTKIQASFADLEYGTSEFSSQQSKLTQVENDLKESNLEWEQLFAKLKS
ncbi:ATP-binding cassette domain-containing protein [bacterium]|nr:ATP-binding cassette domain-containing protein [bacterium]